MVEQVGTMLVWGATTAYAIALVAFATDLARLAERASRPGENGEPPVRRAARVGMAVTTAGWLLHVAGTVLRGVAAGRVPWANMYEFVLMGSLAAVTTFLVLVRRRDVRFLGTLVLGIVTGALGWALAVLYVAADGLQPALQSYWLVIHVSIATIATGMFTVAFVISVVQLLKDSRSTRTAEATAPRADRRPGGGGAGTMTAPRVEARSAGRGLGHPPWAFLASLPSLRHLEAMSFRINAIGFVLWTFTVMAGAIWAEHAWGRYWGWDPKEVWSFVVWVIYAAYLHARTTRGWSGRRAAWFVVAGYAAVIFNFTGVNLFFLGLHSYSGL